MKATTFAIITGAVLSVASVGAAFPYPEMYELDAAGPVSLRPGGAGVYGTGGKHDFGVECNDCHIGYAGTTGLVGIDISLPVGTPQWQSVGGQTAYKPGETYTIQVTMTNERFPNDHNGFAATIEDSSGHLAGVLRSDGTGCAAVASDTANCPTAATTRDCRTEPDPATTTIMLGSCKVVVNQANGDIDTKGHNTSWTFSWTAPAAGAGTVTLFVGVVDGGGVDPTRDAWGNPTNPNRTDLSSLEDETANTTLVLVEGS